MGGGGGGGLSTGNNGAEKKAPGTFFLRTQGLIYALTPIGGKSLIPDSSYCSASQRVRFICMVSQLSAVVWVALAIRIAITGLNADFSLTNSESVFRVTPSKSAASVIVKLSGTRTSSKKTFPGCTGFRICFIILLLLMIILIIHNMRVIVFKSKGYTPIPIY